MKKQEYTYRGIYDKGELGRIEGLLNTQRDLFLEEENAQNDTKSKVTKYFAIVVGIGAIIIITKLITKWK